MTKKDKIILTVAAVVPFGLTALGIWKAYEMIKGKIKDEKELKMADVEFDEFRGTAEFDDGTGSSKEVQE